ncbi:MAG: polysaccharide biosynthesis/export family protein [Pyrinomonadaceae bacterium]|nr:polysaccharide biosynthesis/export family protein [Pyrinomonadaceae bacterium]
MKITVISKIILPALVCGLAAHNVWAQTQQPTPKKVNFGYSQNPKTKTKSENSQTANQTQAIADNFESRSIANKTLEVAKRANNAAVAPTEIYKIGVGDILFVSLQNAPAKDSTYFTVLNDGTIDYPLAGEMVAVGGLTTEEIEDLLKEKVKLYENPQISVKVREHASHKITVLGLVEKAGEKYLQREAMPLFVVRAEAVVQSKARLAVVKRANKETETIDLKDPKSDDVLIFPGDIVEFKSDQDFVEDSSAPQFYYIGGNVASAGQKDFHQGLTLTQAILASGGLKKQTVKKVVVRRKNQAGMLSPIEFDLDSIKAGKQPDPILRAGDTIEITN